MSAFQPFAVVLNLLLNTNVTPNVPQPGYVPLAVTNSDGSAPTISAGFGTAVATDSIIDNAAGPSAAQFPFGVGFVPTALGTTTYTVTADGVTQGTITVNVSDTQIEQFSPGQQVVLALGGTLPTTF